MMTALAYGLLASITLAYLALVRALWRRTHDVSLPIGAAILYMWTFLGAWFFIGDAAVGFEGYRIGFTYYYFMEKMFPFAVDSDYLLALVQYGIFSLVLLATMLFVGPRGKHVVGPVASVSKEVFFFTCLVAMAVSAWSVWPSIQQALAEHRSVYSALHELTGWRKSLHGLLDKAASTAALIGSAVALTSDRERSPLRDRSIFLPAWSHILATGLVCLWLSFTGNRHSLLTAVILSLVYMLSVARRGALRPTLWLVGICGVVLLIGGSLRGMVWTDGGLVAPTAVERPRFTLPQIAHIPQHPSSMLSGVGQKVFSNEFFCAHFSLYGIHSREVPLDPGISFRYLANSFAQAEQRPPSAYDHYAKEARLVEGQGYTIHHAAAWYLNGGIAGMVIGGALLGLIWAMLLRWGSVPLGPKGRSVWLVLRVIVPCAFVAFLPELVRNGPEAFKALLFEGLGIPAAIMTVAALPFKRSDSSTAV